MPAIGQPTSSAASRARRSNWQPRFSESTRAGGRSPRQSCLQIPSSPPPRGGVDRWPPAWRAHPQRDAEPPPRNPTDRPHLPGLSARPAWRGAARDGSEGCSVWFPRSRFILKAATRRSSGYRSRTNSFFADWLPWRRSRINRATASAFSAGCLNAMVSLDQIILFETGSPGGSARFLHFSCRNPAASVPI